MAKTKVTKKSINTKREAKASKEKVVRIPKISWVVKPDGMSLEQWQRALRLQIAREETMSVAVVDERNVPGEYEVWNPLSRQTYKVVYRGEKNETGESHLRIPVPDKQTVNTLLNLVGKLFAK